MFGIGSATFYLESSRSFDYDNTDPYDSLEKKGSTYWTLSFTPVYEEGGLNSNDDS
jgi:hypothetical protein